MGNEVDKRNVLDDEVFTYRVGKENKVFIYWYGKQVKVLKGTASRKFIRQIAGCNHKETQLVMAKVTGNFKRGNERS
jgi:hypothetical protein